MRKQNIHRDREDRQVSLPNVVCPGTCHGAEGDGGAPLPTLQTCRGLFLLKVTHFSYARHTLQVSALIEQFSTQGQEESQTKYLNNSHSALLPDHLEQFITAFSQDSSES